jgi:Poly(ADP-ribose) polymerase and DNA-Ligase Zn-finger region
MAHKIEIALSGRASCRGCKKTLAKGELRFGEEFQNPYSEDGSMGYRYWHLACAATKLANELRQALAAFDADGGAVPDREALDALVSSHLRPEMPHAERAPNGRAHCKGCDEAVKKGDLRVAFERVFEGPMGPQKGAAYVHARCVIRYLERETERGREAEDADAVRQHVLDNSKLEPADLDEARRAMAGTV